MALRLTYRKNMIEIWNVKNSCIHNIKSKDLKFKIHSIEISFLITAHVPFF